MSDFKNVCGCFPLLLKQHKYFNYIDTDVRLTQLMPAVCLQRDMKPILASNTIFDFQIHR